ncbi:hypothetical protein VNI00_011847 [Paramarasmius palmivorus]|uniref:Uncharacterized protein n=1 Tax=Paramarasmius palmivorus TaxID=297713 RepID=A0AAW0C974_9AGAR
MSSVGLCATKSDSEPTSNDPRTGDKGPLLFEIAVQILGIFIEDAKADGEGVVTALLLQRGYNETLFPVVYGKLDISSPSRLARLRRTFAENPYLSTLVRSLCLNFSAIPPLDVDLPYTFGAASDIPDVLAAVSGSVEVLMLSTWVHPDVIHAVRTNVFRRLRVLEAPHYVLLDVPTTIALHARLRHFYRAFDSRSRNTRVTRLTVAAMDKNWPSLERLCIQCTWGVPDEDYPVLDFSHLRGIPEVGVSLTGRDWEFNVHHFLRRFIPPAGCSVIALLRAPGQVVNHELYVGRTFHPKVFIPVFGNPRLFVYCGTRELEYLCALTHVVEDRPSLDAFWDTATDFVRSRSAIEQVFHGEGSVLVR